MAYESYSDGPGLVVGGYSACRQLLCVKCSLGDTPFSGKFGMLSCNASQRGLESWSLDNWTTYCKTQYWFYYHLWKKTLSIDGQKRAVNLLGSNLENCNRSWINSLPDENNMLRRLFTDVWLQAEQVFYTVHHEEPALLPTSSHFLFLPSTSIPNQSASLLGKPF